MSMDVPLIASSPIETTKPSEHDLMVPNTCCNSIGRHIISDSNETRNGSERVYVLCTYVSARHSCTRVERTVSAAKLHTSHIATVLSLFGVVAPHSTCRCACVRSHVKIPHAPLQMPHRMALTLCGVRNQRVLPRKDDREPTMCWRLRVSVQSDFRSKCQA